MILRSSSYASFKRCIRHGYYAYTNGLVLKDAKLSPDLEYGRLLHDAADMYIKTGDVEDGIKLLQQSDLPQTGRKSKVMASILLRNYKKKFTGFKFLESEFNRFNDQDLELPIGKHIWKLRIDSLVSYQEKTMGVENKTTKSEYLLVNPNDQFISYFITMKQVIPDLDGMILASLDSDAVDVNLTFFSPPMERCKEWLKETEHLADYIEKCHDDNIFPKIPSGCMMYGPWKKCIYLPLCQLDTEEERQAMIKDKYEISEKALNLSW